MTDEEKEAFEDLKLIKEAIDKDYFKTRNSHTIEVVENLIEKQQKVINEMAIQLAGLAIFDIEKDEPLILGDKEEVKVYFINKVKEKKS